MLRVLAVSAVLCTACKSDDGSADETLATTSTPAKKGSAGGFSASLSADLAEGSDGKGERTAGTATGAASAGSTSAGAGSNGAGATGAGTTGAGTTGAGTTGAGTTGAGTTGAGTTGAGAGSAKSTMAGGTTAGGSTTTTAGAGTTGAGAGSAKSTTTAGTTTAGTTTAGTTTAGAGTTGAGAGSAKSTTAGGTTAGGSTTTTAGTTTAGTTTAGTTTAGTTTAGSVTPPAPRPPVVLTAELKAIKLSLLPNWKRDVEGAGTISLYVDVQSRDEDAVFKFYYGYDDPRAPADREAYKKFLTDSKILKVALDRQRGAAWYIEGTDGSGPAFRVLVTYGGKRLVCYGSLYKGNGFGDIRDEVVIQAKKICETIQL
jgi:hypothetical protein